MGYEAALSLAALGGILGSVLAYAGHKLHVEVDPRVEEIIAVLPGANCGSCGYPGCAGFADALVKNTAPVDACIPGKAEVAKQIAQIMGQESDLAHMERKIARVICKGGRDNAKDIYQYIGITDCQAAAAQFGGPKDCAQACIGLGSCVKACPFGAIKMDDNQLPIIDTDICTGCGICMDQCPKKVLELIKASQQVLVTCRNKEKAKRAKEACKVACIKCKICEKNCAVEAIKVIADSAGSIAIIDYERCTNCGLCAEKCPVKIITVHEVVSSEVPQVPTQQAVDHDCSHCGLCG